MSLQGLGIMEEVESMHLDLTEKYQYIDENEIRWVFSYQHLGDDEGWFAWMTRPGQIEICVGRVLASEVIERITKNPPLTQDDLIDLELWIKSGGLDRYKPRQGEEWQQATNSD